MTKKTMPKFNFIFLSFFLFFLPSAHAHVNLDKLSNSDIQTVKSILGKMQPLVEKKTADGSLATLKWSELYGPLNKKEKKFLDHLKSLKPGKVGVKTPFQGIAPDDTTLKKIEGQKITKNDKPVILATQYLPPPAFNAYTKMMDAMQKDLKKRLYVGSGYRAPAYQLYLFITYLEGHNYSIKETAQWNALPGFSEHGWPGRQAIDFINEEGVGDEDPKAFEKLEEYRWLRKNARKYGFVLSYPPNNSTGISFEPWHWHYEPQNKP